MSGKSQTKHSFIASTVLPTKKSKSESGQMKLDWGCGVLNEEQLITGMLNCAVGDRSAVVVACLRCPRL